jgi:hypothetical protein
MEIILKPIRTGSGCFAAIKCTPRYDLGESNCYRKYKQASVCLQWLSADRIELPSDHEFNACTSTPKGIFRPSLISKGKRNFSIEN